MAQCIQRGKLPRWSRWTSLSFGLVAFSSCLQLNGDFEPEYHQDPQGHGIEASTSATSSPPHKDTSDTQESDTESSASPDPHSSGANGTSTSSQAPGPTSSSTKGSSTDQSSSSEPLARTKIEIDATQVTEALLSGYPIALTFNHQSLVEQGAQANGEDLVIVSKRNQLTASLPRVLDMQSSWNQSETKIWFTIDQDIPAGRRVDDTYFIVTQDPSLSPIDDRSRIFQGFEDFGGTPPSSAQWSQQLSSEGARSFSTTPDAIVLTAERPSGYPLSYLTLRQQAKSYWPSIRIDVMTRFTNTGLNGDCGRVFPVALRSEGDNRIRAGLRSDIENYAGISYDDVEGINQVAAIPTLAPSSNAWELHSLSWVGKQISYWKDDGLLLNTKSEGSITRPNERNLHLEFSAGTRAVGCTGSGTLGLEIDWYRLRRFTFPEPTARMIP